MQTVFYICPKNFHCSFKCTATEENTDLPLPAIWITYVCCRQQLIMSWCSRWHWKRTVWSLAGLLVSTANKTACCMHTLDSILPFCHCVIVSNAKEVTYICLKTATETAVTHLLKNIKPIVNELHPL